MSPSLFFLLTLSVTTASLLLYSFARRAHRRKLRELASEWKMHFAPDDRFGLAARVAEMLPIPGAANVRVADLIYGNELDGYRYVFSASFSQGVIRSKKRQTRVATFRESRDRDRGNGSAPLILAPEGMSVLQQYQDLRKQMGAGG